MTLDGDESMDKEVRLELNVVKGWVGGPYAPQILALPERGGSTSCQDFFGGFVHNALRVLQSDHSSPKSDNFPTKVCPYSPE